MAKYVCDYDQLNSIAESLHKIGGDLADNISTYASDMTTGLSSWNGTAKKTFLTKCDTQVELATAKANESIALGDFIKGAVDEIQKTDQELAQLTI